MKIEDMTLTQILEYLEDTYGPGYEYSSVVNLYIRCIECDEYIPLCEWNQHKDLFEFETCNSCRAEKEQYLNDEEDEDE